MLHSELGLLDHSKLTAIQELSKFNYCMLEIAEPLGNVQPLNWLDLSTNSNN